MVKCTICGLVLPFKNREVSVNKIGKHYVDNHNIDADRVSLNDYLRCLLEDNHDHFIPLNCNCTEVLFLTPKDLAMHQLREGCDIVDQVGGARVSFFDDAPINVNKRRQKVVSDNEVDNYYNFTMRESNVQRMKMYEFEYERKIENLSVDDMVLPPLSFSEHSIEKIRKMVHLHKFLKDGDGWTYGKMQLMVGLIILRTIHFW